MGGSQPRTYPRYAVDAEIELAATNATARGRSRNLSRGGLCVEVDRAFAVGSAVSIHITLRFDDDGQSEPLALPARVVWCTPIGAKFQLGTQFHGLPSREQTYLEMFLRYLDAHEPARGKPTPDDPFA